MHSDRCVCSCCIKIFINFPYKIKSLDRTLTIVHIPVKLTPLNSQTVQAITTNFHSSGRQQRISTMEVGKVAMVRIVKYILHVYTCIDSGGERDWKRNHVMLYVTMRSAVLL